MKAAEGFLGSAEGQEGTTAFGAVKDAANAFRQMSENLDKRTATITASFDRFTTSGMREVQALSTDGRRTLDDVGRAVRSLEKNPSRVIFGGSSTSIPEYNGRR
jgi:phospholipid/cholesterol/gamma-HCH transport system substrate-binding protein